MKLIPNEVLFWIRSNVEEMSKISVHVRNE